MFKKKYFTTIVALGVSISLAIDVIPDYGKADIKPRTVEVICDVSVDKSLTGFDDKNISYDENSEVVSFTGSAPLSAEDANLFDNVSLLESNEDNIEYYTEESENNGSQKQIVEYSCTFDMNKLEFHFIASLKNETGKVLETEETYTDAIITQYGGLDACIELDGKTYMLSDYENTGGIDECGIGGLIKAIRIYLTVADTAEKIKANSNYKYNQKLEKKGNGVKKGNYITNQSETNLQNYKSGNYRFGFTRFKDVGCEVAAVYNAMIALGKPERLSQTIYCFEAWSIELAGGWGKLGSNPFEISRYLKKKKVSYKKYTSFSSLKKAVAKKNNCKIIMSTWNKPITNGLHTFYIYKAGKDSFRSYNWQYHSIPITHNTLNTFNNGSGFIVGYMVWN